MRALIPLTLLALLPMTLTEDCDTSGVDGDGDGFSPAAGDCDDADSATYPGAPEACDGVDSDCDAAVDEGCDAVIPATEASVSFGHSVSAEGSGVRTVGALDLDANTGALALGGAAHRGVAYHRVNWAAAGYVLYGTVSVAEDGSNFGVTYLYCQGDRLTYLYSESFDHHMVGEGASGSCLEDGPGRSEVSLPALTTSPPGFDTGIDIEGPSLYLEDDAGWIDLAGARWDLHPFSNVDCTDCPGGPWLEIHSVLLRPGEGCFAILYLYPDNPTYVGLSYAFCMPDADLPGSVTYGASWTGGLTPVRTGAEDGPRSRGLWPQPPAGADGR